MFTFAQETYSQSLVEEMKPLWKAHHEEVPGVQDVPLDPDLSVYERCIAAGVVRIYTVRDRQALRGYQIFMVTPHVHSKNSIQANQDILFLSPQSRKGLTGYRFMKWCIAQLQAEGVQVVHQHVSARNKVGRLLEHMGFELQDYVYSRRLS